MKDSSYDLVIKDQQDGGEIKLPVSHEKLSGFISGLLGQSQGIERELYCSFSVDHSWLIHVHSLLDQRIKQQNHASLTDFKAVIFYEGNLKRTLNSVEAFEHFNETKRIVSQSVRITWTYLINFPNKELPEKQEISLYLAAKAPIASRPEDPLRRVLNSRIRTGAISYRVNHTERTWGDDIEALIKQELDQIIEEEGSETVSSVVFTLLAMVFLFGGMIFPDLMEKIIQTQQMESLFADYQSVLEVEALSIGDIGDKLNLVLHTVNPNNGISEVGLGYLLTSFFFGLGMAVWCIFMTEREKLSFVVLTKIASERMVAQKAKKSKSYMMQVLSFIVSIMAGVAGNYIYYILNID